MRSAAPPTSGLAHSRRTGGLLGFAQQREWGVAILLGMTVAIVAIVNRNFLAPENLRDILVAVAPFAIIGCAVTFIIVTGEIDISVGSHVALLAAVLGLLTSKDHAGWPVFPAILIVLALGVAVGTLNGILIAYLRVPSIITTLGMLTALRGVTELLMNGQWIQNLPPGLRFFGIGTLLGIPISIWTTAIVVAMAMVFAVRTPLGRRIYAVGSSPHAAHLAGLSPRRIKLFVFALTGLMVAVATIVSVPQLATIQSGVGSGWELIVVTAVVVGGTSISGGKGTIIGTILAAILLGIIRTVLLFLKLGNEATYWERAIQGAFILLAVLVDHLARRGSGRGEGEEH
jgi:ribose/xylose/arabinose/galactoside ABC-type transport system permease subunit